MYQNGPKLQEYMYVGVQVHLGSFTWNLTINTRAPVSYCCMLKNACHLRNMKTQAHLHLTSIPLRKRCTFVTHWYSFKTQVQLENTGVP